MCAETWTRSCTVRTELDPNDPTCREQPGEGPAPGQRLPAPVGRRRPACEEGHGQQQHRSHAVTWSCRERRTGEERPESQGANRSEIGHTGQGCRHNGPAVEPRDVTLTTGKSAATWRAGSPPRGPAEVKQGSASRARQPPQPGTDPGLRGQQLPWPLAQEQGCFLETRGCRGEGGRAPGAQGGNMAGVWRGRGAKRAGTASPWTGTEAASLSTHRSPGH